MNRDEFESRISARSYALWEREGRKEGMAEAYWERARREIESEFMVAAFEGRTNQFVVPQLHVSQRPVRHDGTSQAA